MFNRRIKVEINGVKISFTAEEVANMFLELAEYAAVKLEVESCEDLNNKLSERLKKANAKLAEFGYSTGF